MLRYIAELARERCEIGKSERRESPCDAARGEAGILPGVMHFARVIGRLPNAARCRVDSGRDATHRLATFVATVFEMIRSEIRCSRTAQMLWDRLAD